MSLINEALKKAQRLRTEDQVDDAAPVPGGSVRVAKRRQARSANTWVLIASGALVLVVVSVVVTVWLLNRPSASPTQLAGAPATHNAPASPNDPATPSLVAPSMTTAIKSAETQATPHVASNPISSTTSADLPASAAATAETEPAIAPPPAPSATPANPSVAVDPVPAGNTVEPPVAIAPAIPAPALPDERISAYVDSIRVTGIRSSGSESRVLMNDRVYRVNDIVERTLGIRLIKVTNDSLTFSDGNGATYVKHF